jgi:hypothetical protein
MPAPRSGLRGVVSRRTAVEQPAPATERRLWQSSVSRYVGLVGARPSWRPDPPAAAAWAGIVSSSSSSCGAPVGRSARASTSTRLPAPARSQRAEYAPETLTPRRCSARRWPLGSTERSTRTSFSARASVSSTPSSRSAGAKSGARSATRWAWVRPGATLKRTGLVVLEPVPFVDAGAA